MNHPDPILVAAQAVEETIMEGLKKHAGESWRGEPMAMHLTKAARHCMTALLILEHPEYTTDAETARSHIKNAITRSVMALCQDINND